MRFFIFIYLFTAFLFNQDYSLYFDGNDQIIIPNNEHIDILNDFTFNFYICF